MSQLFLIGYAFSAGSIINGKEKVIEIEQQ